LAIEADIISVLSNAVATILEAGGGIGISPTCVAASYIRRGALVPVLPGFAVERSVIAALWPESRRDSPNARAFLPLLDEIFPSPRPWDDVCSGDSRACR
jgi:DNA-binding transcriptional LysR family regulator